MLHAKSCPKPIEARIEQLRAEAQARLAKLTEASRSHGEGLQITIADITRRSEAALAQNRALLQQQALLHTVVMAVTNCLMTRRLRQSIPSLSTDPNLRLSNVLDQYFAASERLIADAATKTLKTQQAIDAMPFPTVGPGL